MKLPPTSPRGGWGFSFLDSADFLQNKKVCQIIPARNALHIEAGGHMVKMTHFVKQFIFLDLTFPLASSLPQLTCPKIG